MTEIPPMTATTWSDASPTWLAGAGEERTGAVSVVAALEDYLVPRAYEWHPCRLVPGELYRLRAVVEGTALNVDRAARVMFEGTRRSLGLSESEDGGHIRLHTAPGLHRVDRLFTVDQPTLRMGLRTVENPNTAVIRTFFIERLQPMPIDYFFSFDVEAGGIRAIRDPIGELVWGRIEGGEYGIRRLVGILDEYGLTGNFLIDFGSCLRDGDEPMRRIADYLVSSDHEVHMHLHSDKLSDSWGLRYDPDFRLEASTHSWIRRMLDYTVRSYDKFVGQAPRVFRSGSYRVGASLVLAARTAGIEALTNIKDNLDDPRLGGDRVNGREPFRWENGVVEIPVDVSSPERLSRDDFLRKQANAVARKRFRRTCNVVMHSWSLIRKNDQGVHDSYAPDYEQHFREICELAVTTGRSWGYAEYLDRHAPALPVTARLSHVLPAGPEPQRPVVAITEEWATCNVCDTTVLRRLVVDSACPACQSRPDDRWVWDVMVAVGRLLDGRDVVAHEAHRLRLLQITSGATRIRDLGDESAAGRLPDGEVDCLVCLNKDGDMIAATATIANAVRLLRQGGLFVSTVTSPMTSAYVDLLSEEFDVSAVPGYDAVTRSTGRVVIAYRRAQPPVRQRQGLSLESAMSGQIAGAAGRDADHDE